MTHQRSVHDARGDIVGQMVGVDLLQVSVQLLVERFADATGVRMTQAWHRGERYER